MRAMKILGGGMIFKADFVNLTGWEHDRLGT